MDHCDCCGAEMKHKRIGARRASYLFVCEDCRRARNGSDCRVKIDPLFAGKPVVTRVFPRGYPWKGGWNYSVHSAPSAMPIEQGWQFTEAEAHARVAAIKAAYEAK